MLIRKIYLVFLRIIKMEMINYLKLISLTLFSFLIIIPITLVPAEVEPLVWHEYDYFDQPFPQGYCIEFARDPYAVSVHIDVIMPSPYKVDVTIVVGGIKKWGGLLGVGESSPTINCNDQHTVVHIANPNGNPRLDRDAGYVHWIMH